MEGTRAVFSLVILLGNRVQRPRPVSSVAVFVAQLPIDVGQLSPAREHRPANFCPGGWVNGHRLRVNFHRLGIANRHRLGPVRPPGIAAR